MSMPSDGSWSGARASDVHGFVGTTETFDERAPVGHGAGVGGLCLGHRTAAASALYLEPTEAPTPAAAALEATPRKAQGPNRQDRKGGFHFALSQIQGKAL